MMSDAILSFPQQFAFQPVIEQKKKLKTYTKFVVCGMGGSNLASLLIKSFDPSVQVIIHRDYGVPIVAKGEEKKHLYIFSSYSGNTEETIDGFKIALKKKYPMAVIAVGGKLLELAHKHAIPSITLPHTGIQPRSALGFSVVALLTLMGHSTGLREARGLAKSLDARAIRPAGEALARMLHDRVPVIYSSTKNSGIAYNWKIKMNETGKIPAFYNVLPELNHNEMTGFDVKPASRELSNQFSFLFLTDKTDHPRVQKRMEVLKKLYEDRGLPVREIPLTGKKTMERMFSSLVLADWTAVTIASQYGLESEQVPMVEEFKQLVA